jgi:hypothetical protein
MAVQKEKTIELNLIKSYSLGEKFISYSYKKFKTMGSIQSFISFKLFPFEITLTLMKYMFHFTFNIGPVYIGGTGGVNGIRRKEVSKQEDI